MSNKLSLKDIAKENGVRKMTIYNRFKAITKKHPDFANKYTIKSVNNNGMIYVTKEGANIISNFPNRRRSSEHSTHDRDASSGNSVDITILKTKITGLKQTIKDKDMSIQDKIRELNRVHDDLSHTQQLFDNAQKLSASHTKKYEARIANLNKKLQALPKPSNNTDTKVSKHKTKKGFFARLFSK